MWYDFFPERGDMIRVFAQASNMGLVSRDAEGCMNVKRETFIHREQALLLITSFPTAPSVNGAWGTCISVRKERADPFARTLPCACMAES